MLSTVPSDDLLALTAALVDIPSVSRDEEVIATAVQQRLTDRAPGLDVVRVADNVVARTDTGKERRVVLAGHLDTVPAAGNDRAVVEGDRLSGLGASDMKGGLAVMLRLAEEVASGDAAYDLTFCFYESEEISDQYNGLRLLFDERPDLVVGDVAILLEPTAGAVEAGCQGTLRMQATFRGARAHTARPWQGENAIHKAATVLARIATFEPPTVEVDGLEFREALQVVQVSGGVAANVVPDECVVVVNRRFAPARTFEEAVEEVRAVLVGADEIEVLDGFGPAHPNLSNPLVREMVGALGGEVRAKLGWTDVARFAAHGIPAVNFGPGDALLAHTPGEWVDRAALDACYGRLAAFVRG